MLVITWNPDRAGSNVTLAGADATMQDGPAGLEGGGETLIQISPVIRAAAPQVFDRKNDRFRFSFRVTRKHDSWEALHTFWIAHTQAVLGTGTITVVEGAVTLTLNKATVKANGACNGFSSIWTYQIEGNVA